MSTPAVRNPRVEAAAMLPAGYEARVLEPSPPADRDPTWFADDPTDPSGASAAVVSPTSDGDITWDDLIADHGGLAGYAAEHWLGSRRRLAELPSGYDSTRRGLHQVAFFAVAPRRYEAVGKLGLRFTRGGFGTPFFGDNEQVRVEGVELVVQRGNTVESQPITSIRAATDFLGIAHRAQWFDGFHDPLPPDDPDRALDIGPRAASAIGDWFGFSTAVLEELRRTDGAADVSRVQLWPEHFDPAIEMGASSGRASYGASPGDDAHPEPYLYVAAWDPVDRADAFWNDEAFNGASMSYRELLDADDQFVAALDFYHRGHELLAGAP